MNKAKHVNVIVINKGNNQAQTTFTLYKQLWYKFELSVLIKKVTIPSEIKMIQIALSRQKPQSYLYKAIQICFIPDGMLSCNHLYFANYF